MGQIGSVELALPWNGDLSFKPGGDLVLARDDDGTILATTQRIVRLILSNPVITDSSGNPIGRPTDLNHPNWGSGLGALVGESPAYAIPLATTNIRNSLIGDPGLDPSYTPVIDIEPIANQVGQFSVTVTAKLTSGQIFTFPSVVVGG